MEEEGWSEDVLQRVVVRAASDVFAQLGSGYAECVYHKALLHALRMEGLQDRMESHYVVPVTYRGYQVGIGEADVLLWDDAGRTDGLVVELKAIVAPPRAGEEAQVRTYMRALGLTRGLVINFPQTGVNAARSEIDVLRASPAVQS